ncbi:MAG: AAA family ATPase, partial [Chloroflexales bacterium]
RGVVLPDYAHGAALFADISGFTPLTEALTQALGSRVGGEQLTDEINAVYTALTTVVARWCGSVISFAGDAMTCWFDDGDGPAAPRAAACGCDLQTAMAAFATLPIPGWPPATLALKVAVATGPARRFAVGDPTVQRLDVLAGATLDRMAAGEHLAHPGEVLLDAATVTALGPRATLGVSRTDPATGAEFFLLQTLTVPPVGPRPAVVLPVERMRPWVLPVVCERYQAELGAFLSELRPTVILFLRFGGIDYDGDPQAGVTLDRLVCQVQQLIVARDGSLLQLATGDKGSYLYAAFGAPVAHEDDASRAAQTAISIHAALTTLGFPPAQIGLSQGTLRVGAYGGEIRRTYGVLGDEVNLAARLMVAAAPGETLLTGHVQAALNPIFLCEPRPPLTVKGKAEPIPVFSLTGVAHQRAVRLQEPTYTLPMMGRATEVAQITALMTRVRQAQGQVVGIVGEAGIGKSRLVAEVVRLARRQGFSGYGGAAQSGGTNTAYLIWQPIFQALFDLDPDAPVRRQLRLIADDLEERVPERLQALPLLSQVLDLPIPENDFTRTLDPHERRGALDALLIALLEQATHEAAPRGGLLLVLEDLHWIDPLSLDLLAYVAAMAEDLPLLLVLAYRPLDHQRRQTLRIEGLPHFTRFTLDPLAGAALDDLVRAKLAQLFPARAGVLPPGLVPRLFASTQGNPFYVEEVLNYVRDQGANLYDPAVLATLELPESLHRLVLARIDQLTARERTTLRVA